MIKLYGHYPHLRFHREKKIFWNPVLKRMLSPLPEEAVRLKLLDFIIRECSWPTSRISMESGIDMPSQKGRTDMICYTQAFDPHLLIECKASDVRLNAKTGIQIARYNDKLNASFLCVSNGHTTYFFNNAEVPQEVDLKDVFPDWKPASVPDSLQYWHDRGFAGNPATDTRKWLTHFLNHIYLDEKHSAVFIKPPDVTEFDLAHYYRIWEFPHIKLAISVQASPHGDTNLIALASKQGELQGVLILNLDLVRHGVQPEATLIKKDRTTAVRLSEHLSFNFDSFQPSEFDHLLNRIAELFT